MLSEDLWFTQRDKVVELDMLVVWNDTSWLEFYTAQGVGVGMLFLVSSSLFAVRIPLLLGTWSSEHKTVTGAMLICYHGDLSGNIQTCHQARHTSASFWVPEGFLCPYSHQFKVHFCWDFASECLEFGFQISWRVWDKEGTTERCLKTLKQQSSQMTNDPQVQVMDSVITLLDKELKVKHGGDTTFLHSTQPMTVDCEMLKYYLH